MLLRQVARLILLSWLALLTIRAKQDFHCLRQLRCHESLLRLACRCSVLRIAASPPRFQQRGTSVLVGAGLLAGAQLECSAQQVAVPHFRCQKFSSNVWHGIPALALYQTDLVGGSSLQHPPASVMQRW